MFQRREGLLRGGALMAICLTISGGFCLLQSAVPVLGQGPDKSKTTATAAKPDLAGDIKIAIQLIEKNDFKTFIELYCPVEMLRKLRQQDLVDRAATVMASQPKLKPQLLSLLNALQVKSAKFDKSGGLASLEFDTSSASADEIPGELNIPETADLTLTGLGGDLPRTITEAVKLLEAGDVGTFLDRMFPASELARLQAPDARLAMLQQFKDTPELATSIIADLKLIQAMKHEMSKDGKVATYSISSGEPRVQRSIKFQKVGANWRLYDDSPRVITELNRQAKLLPGSGVKQIQMERIGGNWRFIELPMLRLDGQ